jgi:AbrB family looped-hinge helix DNA binding protein
MSSSSRDLVTTVEATITSKGQITLPSELRKRLGLQKGSRIRFSIPSSGPVEMESVRYELEDLWRIAGAGPKPTGAMSFEEMNAAKARRKW